MARPEPTPEWVRNHPEGKPGLAWTAADYEAWSMDIPPELSDGTTEADLMHDDDVSTWIRDSVATIKVIAESDIDRAVRMRLDFIADLHYLLSLKKVSEEIIDFALDEANFKWYDGRDGE